MLKLGQKHEHFLWGFLTTIVGDYTSIYLYTAPILPHPPINYVAHEVLFCHFEPSACSIKLISPH